jgi:glycosyltransferase involved in cell wall biosynthesis
MPITSSLKLKKSAGVPVSLSVHRLLTEGNQARDARDWTRAAARYGAALDADPALAHIWIQYGHALREGGDGAAAAQAYARAADLTPDASDALLHLGHAHKDAGDRAAATRAYLAAARVDRNPDAVTELHRLLAMGDAVTRDGLLALLGDAPAPVPDEDPVAQARGALAALEEALRRQGGGDAAALATLARTRDLLGTLGLGDGAAEADVDAPVIVFDVSDLVAYFRNARLPTGIQRVQIEVIRSALDAAAARTRVCAFQEGRDAWVEIPAAAFRQLAQLSLADGDRAGTDWLGALTRLQLHLATQEAIRFPDGAWLVNLGTSWWLQNYFLFVRQAKAEHDVRYVPFVHDMIPVMAGEHCTRELTQDFITWVMGAFEHADFFLANSQSTKRDLLEVARRLGHQVDAAQVAVIPLDAAFRLPDRAAAPAATLARWGLRAGGFVLFVSTVESRKNHLGAFEAWIELLRRHGGAKVPRLVCVGNRGWLNDAVYARLESHAELRARVTMLSGLSDAQLALLYDSCLFTLYPSNYEGWGLPVTEALCHGKVPVVADASSLPEAGGDFAVYFEAGSVRRMTEAVEPLILDAGRREALEARIREDFRPRAWSDVSAQITGAVAGWARQAAPAGHRAASATLGAHHPIVRNFETRIWRGMRSAEVFRVGAGWWGPDDWGCWTRPGGAQLAIGLPAGAPDALRLYVCLHGFPRGECAFQLRVEGGPARCGVLREQAFRWIALDVAGHEDVLRVRVESPAHFDLGTTTGGLDPRLVSVGVAGFFVCARDDTAARQAFVEALQFDDLAPLHFARAPEAC